MTSHPDTPPSPEERDADPLLDDMREARERFRRSVASMAAELKELRRRLSLTEQSCAQETLTRQEAEDKVRCMEEEISRLQRSLEERNGAVNASKSAAERYLKELDELRFQLTTTQATADASAASAQAAQLQCFALLMELDEKNYALKEHEDRVRRLAEQLDSLQNELQSRELSQKQLKDEVMRVEHDIMEAVANARVNKDCELWKILDEVSPNNLEKMNKILKAKDEEITRLKNEIRTLSAHWKLKTKELESQMEKHRKVDRELKKRVLKLEVYLQEARSQTRKLQRMGERRDKDIKKLMDKLSSRHTAPCKSSEKQKFLESSSLKILISMSVLVLVVFSKR